MFPCNARWIPKAPRWVSFFTWLAKRGAILITENLRKWKVVCINCCFMCKEAGENVDHLFLLCSLIVRSWWIYVGGLALHG